MAFKAIYMDFDDKRTELRTSFYYKSGEVDVDGIEVQARNIDLTNATGLAVFRSPAGESIVTALNIEGDVIQFFAPSDRQGVYEYELQVKTEAGVAITATNRYEVLPSLRVVVTEGMQDLAHQLAQMLSYLNIKIEQWQLEQDKYMQAELERKNAFEALVQHYSDLVRDNIQRFSNYDARFVVYDARLQTMREDVDAWLALAESIINGKVAEVNNAINTMNTNFTNKANELTSKVDASITKNETKTQDCIDDITEALAAGTNDLETKNARKDSFGVTHDVLKTRLDVHEQEIYGQLGEMEKVDFIESTTVQGTQAGVMKNTTLTGQTMVNVAGDNRGRAYIDYTEGKTEYYGLQDFAITPKRNTIYTIAFTVENLIIEKGAPSATLRGYLLDNSFSQLPFSYILKSGYNVKTFGVNGDYKNFLIGIGDSSMNNVKCNISNLLILEGDHTDKPLEFFEGLKSAEVAEINTHGVNLVDNSKNLFGTGMNDGGVIGTTGAHANRTLTDFISVSDVKTYTTWGGSGTFFNFYDENKTCINPTRVNVLNNLPFSIPSGSKFARFFVSVPDSTTMYLYEVTGSEPSTYVPYTSSKTTLSEPITLRSLPNGVADTYDVDTGVLTRRCGEVVLNGSESWSSSSYSVGDYSGFFVSGHLPNLKSGSSNLNDKFKNTGVWSNPLDDEFLTLGTNIINISIAKSKLTTPDVAGFKAWLAQNPTTVVYQLAEPTQTLNDAVVLLPEDEYDDYVTDQTPGDILIPGSENDAVIMPGDMLVEVEPRTSKVKVDSLPLSHDYTTTIDVPSVVPVNVSTRLSKGRPNAHAEQIAHVAKKIADFASSIDFTEVNTAISNVDQRVTTLSDTVKTNTQTISTNTNNITTTSSNLATLTNEVKTIVQTSIPSKLDKTLITYGTSNPLDSDGKPDGTLYFKYV